MDMIWRYDSPLGAITLAGTEEGLAGLWFDGQRYFAASLDAEHTRGWLPVFGDAIRWLDIYFSGRDPGFRPSLTVRGSAFQQAVLERLSTIPYGETATYGQIAARMGLDRTAARAVGGAIARNPISLIIPCHRVVGADGRLTGYAGGVERKAWLLARERGEIHEYRA